MINWTSLRSLDWVMLGSILVLGSASLVSLASSDINFFWRQFIWYIFSAVIIFFGSQIDWRWLIHQSWFRYGFYFLSIFLLMLSNLQSQSVRGTKAWLAIGSFQFEPSELTKIALIVLLASFFSRRYVEAWLSKNIVKSFIYAFVPTFLIVLQPDLGSALVLVSIWAGFLLLSGINYKRLFVGLLVTFLIALLLWFFLLKPYQKDRLIGFIFPEEDPLGVNYNVIQSKIAIGSAGFFGKGFGGGTQTQLKFLPESQTDFLLAAFIEEWGILGGTAVLAAFFLLIYRIVHIGLRAKRNDFKFISLGTGLVFMTHFLVNAGSNLGLMPVAGIPFPFLSYGGSNLLTAATLISIIEHIQLESR